MAMDFNELLAKQEELNKKKVESVSEGAREVTKVLTFAIDDQIYGIEIPNVIEIIGIPRITTVPGVPYYIKGIINVRSKVVPVVDIRSRFGKEEIEYNERSSTIIVSYEDIQVGIIVDEVRDVLSVFEKYIAKSPNHIGVNNNKFIKYLLEMPDGIKLVLDVNKLVYENDAYGE